MLPSALSSELYPLAFPFFNPLFLAPRVPASVSPQVLLPESSVRLQNPPPVWLSLVDGAHPEVEPRPFQLLPTGPTLGNLPRGKGEDVAASSRRVLEGFLALSLTVGTQKFSTVLCIRETKKDSLLEVRERGRKEKEERQLDEWWRSVCRVDAETANVDASGRTTRALAVGEELVLTASPGRFLVSDLL